MTDSHDSKKEQTTPSRLSVSAAARLLIEHSGPALSWPDKFIVDGVAWRELRDALKTVSEKTSTPSAAAVPEGWKLVPVDPTAQMHNLAHQAEPKVGRKCRERIYKAMLFAAPQPPKENDQ